VADLNAEADAPFCAWSAHRDWDVRSIAPRAFAAAVSFAAKYPTTLRLQDLCKSLVVKRALPIKRASTFGCHSSARDQA
jgi:hypothetical protein